MALKKSDLTCFMVLKYLSCLVFFLVAFNPWLLQAQVNRYVVHLNTKGEGLYSIDEPQAFLGPRAIDRRQKQGISITEADFPIDPDLIKEIEEEGAKVFYSSRWFSALLVEADQGLLPALKALSIVDSVEFVAPGAKLGGPAQSREKPGNSFRFSSRAQPTQNNMLAIDVMHESGYLGEGILLAVFDGGFRGYDEVEFFEYIRERGKIKHTYDFVSRGKEVGLYDDHGTRVLSVISAWTEEDFIGAAPEVDLILAITEDVSSEYRIEEYNWLFAAEWADSIGVDIINTSLGYNIFDDNQMNYSKAQLDGNTALISRASNEAAARGILLVASAGNEGNISWQTITAPADSEDVFAIGAIDANGRRASFSSIGPTADGRIKPDLVALGRGTIVGNQNGAFINTSGTSFAAPLVAGLAAGYWQANPELSNLEVLENLRNSGHRATDPNDELGYGIPDFKRAQSGKVLDAEEIFEGKMTVFPNPVTQNTVFVRVSGSMVGTPLEFSLVSQNGQSILNTQHQVMNEKDLIQLDMSETHKGIYFLTVRFNNETKTVKLINF